MNAAEPDFQVLAERHGLSAEALRERWCEGFRGSALLDGHALLPVTRDWVNTVKAAEILGTTISTLRSLDTRGLIRNHSRSVSSSNARGAGSLWCRADLESAARVRDVTGISLGKAIRVMAALRDGRL